MDKVDRIYCMKSKDVYVQGKARQGKARQGKARQGKARQGKGIIRRNAA